jgi:hypothetical protein
MTRTDPPGHLFIVGCARTGSTLIQHILNRAPEVCLAPETHFMKRSRRLRLGERLRSVRSEPDLRDIVDVLYREDRESRRGGWAWLRRNIAPERFLAELASSERSERAIFDAFMRLYAEWLKPEGGVRVLGEKTPGHLLHVPRLLEWYPDARILQTFRDPRAVYASELRRRRQGRWGLKSRLTFLPDGLLDPVLPPIQLGHTAVRWRQAATLDRRYAATLGPRYTTLRFEDLIARPEEEVRRITAFLGVPFRQEMLDVRITGSSYSAGRYAGEGLDPAAGDRWREHVGPMPRTWFRLTLGNHMRHHRYTA